MDDKYRPDEGRRTTDNGGARFRLWSFVLRRHCRDAPLRRLVLGIQHPPARGPPHPQGRSRADRPRDLEHRARPLRAGDQRRSGEHAAHRSRRADFPARRTGLLAVGRRASAPHPPGGGVGARRVADLSARAKKLSELALSTIDAAAPNVKRQTSEVTDHASLVIPAPLRSEDQRSHSSLVSPGARSSSPSPISSRRHCKRPPSPSFTRWRWRRSSSRGRCGRSRAAAGASSQLPPSC